MLVTITIKVDGEVELTPGSEEEAVALMGALGLITNGQAHKGTITISPFTRTPGHPPWHQFQLECSKKWTHPTDPAPDAGR